MNMERDKNLMVGELMKLLRVLTSVVEQILKFWFNPIKEDSVAKSAKYNH